MLSVDDLVGDGLLRYAGATQADAPVPVERVILARQYDDLLAATGETDGGGIVAVAQYSPCLHRAMTVRGVVGLVVVGGAAETARLAGIGNAAVLLPAGSTGPVSAPELTRMLESRRLELNRALEHRAMAAERLTDLIEEGVRAGSGPSLLVRWAERQLGARVDLVDPADLPPHLARTTQVKAMAAGRRTGPYRGTTGIEETLLWPVGLHASRWLLRVRRAEVLEEWEEALARRVAGGAGILTRMADLARREQWAASAVADARVAALQHLMDGQVRDAARTVGPAADELAAAGSGTVAVVECAAGEDRHAVALAAEQAAPAALVVRCPVQATQVIVVHPVGHGDPADLLAPLVGRVTGRAAGLSQITPWERTGTAYETAVEALSHARDHRTRLHVHDGHTSLAPARASQIRAAVAALHPSGAAARPRLRVHDGRAPLAERLGGDARIWAALVTQPLAQLEPAHRADLLGLARTTLWWGAEEGAKLTGWSANTLRERLDRVAELTGLDLADYGQRAALYLAARLSVLPPPVVLDRRVTLDHVLDHPGARDWAQQLLGELTEQQLAVLAARVTSASTREAYGRLGMSQSTYYKHLKAVVTTTGLEVTQFCGPRSEAALALHIYGTLPLGTLPDLSGRQLAPAQQGMRSPVPVDETDDQFDTQRAHPARVYDVALGGSTNFAADRDAAQALFAVAPHTPLAAQSNRAMMHRVTRHLAEDRGIRQFLDLGSGIPKSPNLHDIAGRVDASSRTVYVDADPIVHLHAEAALKEGTSAGNPLYLREDITQAADLLAHPGITSGLDLTQPVGLSLYALLHFLDDDVAYPLVRELCAALAPGSYLVLSHVTPDYNPGVVDEAKRVYSSGVSSVHFRTRPQIERFFTDSGADLITPGLVPVARWYPADPDAPLPPDGHVNIVGAVASIRS